MGGKKKRAAKVEENDVGVKPDIKPEIKEESLVNDTDSEEDKSEQVKKETKDKDWRYFGKGKTSGKAKLKPARGVVYVSCLPHGFYEKQLDGYFGQFGKVTGVYVPKSKKTGKSKGYAFVEFLHPEVAQVAAETMNNYLMFNRLIKTQIIPPEKQKSYMFKEKYKMMKPQYSESKIKQNMAKQRRNFVKNKESYLKKATNKVRNLQESLKSLGIEYKFKVAGLRDEVILTGLKNIDPDEKINEDPVEVKEDSTGSTQPSASQKKKNRRKKSKVSPLSSEPNRQASDGAVVLFNPASKSKGSIVKKTVKLLAAKKQELSAGKNKVVKLVTKTIDKSKNKEKVNNSKKIKKIAVPGKRKQGSIKNKLETTV